MRNLVYSKSIRKTPAHLLVVLVSVFLLNFGAAHAENEIFFDEPGMEQEYIHTLDLTVIESDRGDIQIAKIGYYSPFRRYSWFRVGDVIESVNGEKTTLITLYGLAENETPWIKYRRGFEVSEKQIGLEKVMYGPPDFLDMSR
ncbi:hypothetical protein UZ36_00285 [Candidatus Nitromaritima sp. SCGC AAA799-C22]|nr:hypothetical protein UZ36_00285 [Candidatus Nitromaritima sp. SCGC AAA799-C22]